jgi:hypothetical protein
VAALFIGADTKKAAARRLIFKPEQDVLCGNCSGDYEEDNGVKPATAPGEYKEAQ